jgi:hypothetical protein
LPHGWNSQTEEKDMKRYVIKYNDGSFAGGRTFKVWVAEHDHFEIKQRVTDLQSARVYGNIACAKNSKGWTRGGRSDVIPTVVEVFLTLKDDNLVVG